MLSSSVLSQWNPPYTECPAARCDERSHPLALSLATVFFFSSPRNGTFLATVSGRSRVLVRALVARQLSRKVVREMPRRDHRQQRQTGHDQESDLQRTQARLCVHTHSFLHLLPRSGRVFHHAAQSVVADESDIFEIDLRLDLLR